MFRNLKYILVIVIIFLLADISKSQTRDEILAGKMRVSPKASVSETVGFTKIEIE